MFAAEVALALASRPLGARNAVGSLWHFAGEVALLSIPHSRFFGITQPFARRAQFGADIGVGLRRPSAGRQVHLNLLKLRMFASPARMVLAHPLRLTF